MMNTKKYKLKEVLNISDDNNLVCFTNLTSLNNNNKFNKIIASSIIGLSESCGYWSACHKLDKDVFIIDNDQDNSQPNIYLVYKEKKFIGVYIHCGLFAEDFEVLLKNNKYPPEHRININDQKFLIFRTPDNELNPINKKKIKKESLIKDFVEERTNNNKFLELNVHKGKYNIYTFNSAIDGAGDAEVAGHFIELKKID